MQTVQQIAPFISNMLNKKTVQLVEQSNRCANITKTGKHSVSCFFCLLTYQLQRAYMLVYSLRNTPGQMMYSKFITYHLVRACISRYIIIYMRIVARNLVHRINREHDREITQNR